MLDSGNSFFCCSRGYGCAVSICCEGDSKLLRCSFGKITCGLNKCVGSSQENLLESISGGQGSMLKRDQHRQELCPLIYGRSYALPTKDNTKEGENDVNSKVQVSYCCNYSVNRKIFFRLIKCFILIYFFFCWGPRWKNMIVIPVNRLQGMRI